MTESENCCTKKNYGAFLMRQFDHPTRRDRVLHHFGSWSVIVFLPLVAVLVPSVLTQPSKPEGGSADTQKKGYEESALTWRTVEVKLRRGDTLASVLARFGLDHSSAQAAVEAMRPMFNPRRLRAGESLRLLLDPQEPAVQGVEYRVDNSVLRVLSTGEGWSADLEEIPFVRKATVVHGTISDSLYQDGVGAGLAPLQILDLATIFESDIDFFADFQKGDAFAIAFEKIRYADGRRDAGRVLAAEITAGGKSFHAIYYSREDGRGSYYDLKGAAVRRAFLRAPLSYRRISSPYSSNRRHPIFRTVRPHRAIDYAAPAGTPVVAIGRGRVSYAGWRGRYGKLVEIRHPNGYTTRYAHFSRIASGVRAGKRLDQGDVIGYVGETGHATGPHLHFEILRGGKKVNFLTLKLPPSGRLTGKELERFYDLRDQRVALLQERPAALARSNT